jgi:hypothetical protein
MSATIENIPAIATSAKAKRAARWIRRHERKKALAGKLYAEADAALGKAAALLGPRRIVEVGDGQYRFIEDQFASGEAVWAHAAARRWNVVGGDLGSVTRKLTKSQGS